MGDVVMPDWATGMVDLHVHASPSLLPRHGDDAATVDVERHLGFETVVLKAHEGSTAERAIPACAASATSPAVAICLSVAIMASLLRWLVAFGCVLSKSSIRNLLARRHFVSDRAADRCLDWHLEHLTRNEIFQFGSKHPTCRLRTITVDNRAQRIHRFAVHQNVELHEWRDAIPRLGVVKRCVSLCATLQLVEIVNDQFRERDLESHHDALLIEIVHPVENPTLAR